MPYLFLGLAALAGLILLVRWAMNAEPATLGLVLKVLGGLAAVAVVLLLAWRGPAALLLIPVAGGGYYLWRRGKTGARRGRRPSLLRTATLNMTLDAAGGRLDGTVRVGPHQGRRLSRMPQEHLLALLEKCRTEDPQSVPLLEAFLDDTFGPQWRPKTEIAAVGDTAPQVRAMSREEAYAVLGLEPGASDQQIRQAHQRLMRKLHPDRGGTSYLAARLTEARDLLLGA